MRLTVLTRFSFRQYHVLTGWFTRNQRTSTRTSTSLIDFVWQQQQSTYCLRVLFFAQESSSKCNNNNQTQNNLVKRLFAPITFNTIIRRNLLFESHTMCSSRQWIFAWYYVVVFDSMHNWKGYGVSKISIDFFYTQKHANIFQNIRSKNRQLICLFDHAQKQRSL